MNSSVSLEVQRELIDGALFYAREANAELGLAFITEFERSLGVLCNYPRLRPVWRGTHVVYHYGAFRTPAFTRSNPWKFESSRSRTRAVDLGTGVVASDVHRRRLARLSPDQRFDPTRSGGLRLPTQAGHRER